MTAMAPCCGNCRFWERSTAQTKRGECRRNAPPVLSRAAGPDWLWPTTRDSAFCGEHQPAGFRGVADDGARSASVPEVTG